MEREAIITRQLPRGNLAVSGCALAPTAALVTEKPSPSDLLSGMSAVRSDHQEISAHRDGSFGRAG